MNLPELVHNSNTIEQFSSHKDENLNFIISYAQISKENFFTNHNL